MRHEFFILTLYVDSFGQQQLHGIMASTGLMMAFGKSPPYTE